MEDGNSLKIITALDTLATLAVEQIGYTYQLPAYHPLIIGAVLGSTYLLLKYKNEVVGVVLSVPKLLESIPSYLIFFSIASRIFWSFSADSACLIEALSIPSRTLLCVLRFSAKSACCLTMKGASFESS